MGERSLAPHPRWRNASLNTSAGASGSAVAHAQLFPHIPQAVFVAFLLTVLRDGMVQRSWEAQSHARSGDVKRYQVDNFQTIRGNCDSCVVLVAVESVYRKGRYNCEKKWSVKGQYHHEKVQQQSILPCTVYTFKVPYSTSWKKP